MPQAIPVVASSSRDGKKRRGYEAALSPRPSPPRRTPMATQERLPPIHTLLSDIPQTSERTLSQLRAPMRQDATGPRPVIPARLSPPPASRRSHIQSNTNDANGSARSPRRPDQGSSGRSNYDRHHAYQLPIHSGPPPNRNGYSPSVLSPAPVSPYATSSLDARRGYYQREPHSLPPPPTPYEDMPRGHSPYAPHRDYSNGDQRYGANYYEDGQHRNVRSHGQPLYQSTHAPYQPVSYAYPTPPASVGSNYTGHHQYQNGYHQGSVQFESDESGGSVPRRRRGNLPRDTTDMLKQWFTDHLSHPYPSEDEKQMLCRQTGLQMTQISNWFINARRRRIPELVNQATAETRLRDHSGESSASSD